MEIADRRPVPAGSISSDQVERFASASNQGHGVLGARFFSQAPPSPGGDALGRAHRRSATRFAGPFNPFWPARILAGLHRHADAALRLSS